MVINYYSIDFNKGHRSDNLRIDLESYDKVEDIAADQESLVDSLKKILVDNLQVEEDNLASVAEEGDTVLFVSLGKDYDVATVVNTMCLVENKLKEYCKA